MPESNAPIESSFNHVSVLAKQRLIQLLRGREPDFREAYLFHQDHVCGLKISSGPFVAKWCEGSAEIEFFRGQTSLGTVSVTGTAGRQAA